jgi:hypothetical protein
VGTVAGAGTVAGTVAGVGAWAEWVCSELGDLVVAGTSSLESCEVSVDLMEAIGASGLLGRGQVAQSRVERASGLLVGAASAWHEALQAVLAMASRGAGPPAGPAGETEGPVGCDVAFPGGKVEFPGDTAPAVGEAGAAEVEGPGGGQAAGTAPAGASQAGEVPVRPAGRWDRVKDRVPFQHAAVHGPLRGWGLTERSWKKTSSGGCELGLVPAAEHVPHSDPVNDAFWVEAVDGQGNAVEGPPLFSARDRLGGQEQYTEPSRRQALQELIEDKGPPKAISAGTRTAALTGLGTVGGVLTLQGGQTAAARPAKPRAPAPWPSSNTAPANTEYPEHNYDKHAEKSGACLR